MAASSERETGVEPGALGLETVIAIAGLVPSGVLLPALALILLISAFGLWRHSSKP